MHTRICQPSETADLRRRVLRPALDKGAPLAGDEIAGAIHLGVFSGAELLSAGVIFAEPCPFRSAHAAWRLRGMATEPAQRGTGAGTLLLQSACEIVRAAGGDLLWCFARSSAVGFYLRDGWRLEGVEFESVGLPHRQMWRAVDVTARSRVDGLTN